MSFLLALPFHHFGHELFELGDRRVFRPSIAAGVKAARASQPGVLHPRRLVESGTCGVVKHVRTWLEVHELEGHEESFFPGLLFDNCN